MGVPVTETMQTILILNSKGGCGKTTLATNLASLYATGGIKTALMDYDPQGSSLLWHSLRSNDLAAIHMIDANKTQRGLTRTWQLAVPRGTKRLIIDAPAGIKGGGLQDLVRKANIIVVPVTPSPIDIHATSAFIKDLLLTGKARSLGVHIGVVANRVRRNSPHYAPLHEFLNEQKIPFITSFTDTENYIRAAEKGMGIYELPENQSVLEREQWLPLIRWLACPESPPQVIPDFPKLSLVSGGR